MREFSWPLGSTVARLAKYSFAVSLLCPCLFSSPATAIEFRPVPSPNLDLSQLGRVALVGDFDSISLYNYEGQTEAGISRNGSQSLLTRLPNGVFTTLASADGTIEAMCPFRRRDGSLAGIVVGGNFTSLGGTEASGIALFDPVTSAVTALPGLSGKVSALLCDDKTGSVYVGGSFLGGDSTNAIAWVEGWAKLPFAGFNGAVSSITKAANGNIVFGGEFDGLGNTTIVSEQHEQVIALSSADVTASPSAQPAGLSDPRNIICKTSAQQGPGNTWLLQDLSSGFWQARFSFGIQPTKLRLYNTQIDGRGTKEWRFTALPLNGIMNFSYVDPTGQKAFCDARCPLPQNNATFQDFEFVNIVRMDAFRIDISDWYGNGAGLNGITLFQDDINSYAINNFNEPACEGIDTSPKSSVTGPWQPTSSGQSTSNYLTARMDGATANSLTASVIFQPSIKQSGNYSILVYTPGCIQDNTCTVRGRVNVTVSLNTGSTTQQFATEIFQTNNFDKYDTVYSGFIDASLSPTITVAPSAGQTGFLTFVAQRVRLDRISASGGLNGIYEYDPDSTAVDADFSKSAINRAGSNLEPGATVTSLEQRDGRLFVGGNFSTSDFTNVFSIENDAISSLPGGGLNDAVLTMFQLNSILYLGGSFTTTRSGAAQGISNVAAFSTRDNLWQPLGAGVNGIVNRIAPLTLNITDSEPELVLSVNGVFDQVLGFGSNRAFATDGFAIWVPSRNNWLRNLESSTVSIKGYLTAQTSAPGLPELLAGSISLLSMSASGAVGLRSEGSALQKLPITFLEEPKEQSDLTSAVVSRRLVNGQDVNGVAVGQMYQDNGLNITILGGGFTALGSNGSVLHNLAFINGSDSDDATGITAGLDTNSTFLALATRGTTLFAGGAISGTLDGDTVNGIVLYDLAGANFVENQPPALSGSDVVVTGIRTRPKSPEIYVGGSFDSAGSLGCPALCIYDVDRAQWISPGAGLAGSVLVLGWVTRNRLLIGGELRLNGAATPLATYDANERAFKPFSGGESLPGPISALTPANDGSTQIWVGGKGRDGAPFLSKFDGSTWTNIGDRLGRGSTIKALQIFKLTENHEGTDLMPANQALLVMGQLEIPGFGTASGALFNGTDLRPYILTNTAANAGGSISQTFVQNPRNFFAEGGKRLALGFVVLIALAIALALTFLLVVAGIIAERIRRRRDGYVPAPARLTDKGNNLDRIPPEHLFSSVNRPGGPVRI